PSTFATLGSLTVPTILPRSTCAIRVQEQLITTKAKANLKARLTAEDASIVPPRVARRVESNCLPLILLEHALSQAQHCSMQCFRLLGLKQFCLPSRGVQLRCFACKEGSMPELVLLGGLKAKTKTCPDGPTYMV